MSAGDMWWAPTYATAMSSQQFVTASGYLPLTPWPPLSQETVDEVEKVTKKPKPKEPDGPWEYDDTGIFVEPTICGKILK